MWPYPYILGVSVSLTLAPLVLHYILEKREQKRLQSLKEINNQSYYECIFVDYKNFGCRSHLINKEECGPHCAFSYLERLLHFLASAKTSISMCMYMLTLKQVATELVNAHKRGVTVRLITDKGMSKTVSQQSNLAYLRKNGVAVKVSFSENELMHHKYCLVDETSGETAKVFFGSVNLTAQALSKNFEALIFTNNINVISRLSEEFEDLWLLF